MLATVTVWGFHEIVDHGLAMQRLAFSDTPFCFDVCIPTSCLVRKHIGEALPAPEAAYEVLSGSCLCNDAVLILDEVLSEFSHSGLSHVKKLGGHGILLVSSAITSWSRNPDDSPK